MIPVINCYVKLWQHIFKLAEGVDFHKALSPKILSDPNNKFVQTIIYIYSMQTFVYDEINNVSRNKNVDKIQMFGPFAAALSYIIHCGNINKSVFKSGFSVFRGLKLTQDEIEQRYQVGSSINLKGFTSTSINKKVALNFAFSDVVGENVVIEKLPVLIEI